jgi:ABC-2 type transport system ATP-binding protein
MEEKVIEVRNVFKTFKNVEAVKGISINVKKGQFLAILGPNGAGKTTLVEMIEGIQKPDSGEILITGKKWKGHEDELHRILGLSLQETFFIEKLRVIETLKLFASFYKLKNDRVEEIIELVGLQEKRKANTVNLSGGQKQRLALGIALMNNPKIILLDEPTTGLDPNARREIWSILHKLKDKSETSIILTTHYMEEAEQLCDRIIIMDHGQILKEGSLNDLLSVADEEKIIEFVLEKPPAEFSFSKSDFQIQWDSKSQKGTLKLLNFEKNLPIFFAFLETEKLKLKSFEFRKKTLDDLFINLTGRHLHES